MPKIMYKCNPFKNKECPKTSCYLNGGPCTMTKKIEYAEDPENKVFLIMEMGQEEFE